MKRNEKMYAFYTHHLVNEDLFYVGITSNPKGRFYNSSYKETSMGPYLDMSVPFIKNQNIETECTELLYTYDEATFIEDWFIRTFKPGKCINQIRSGLITKDGAKYQREWLAMNPDKREEKRRKFAEWQKQHREERNRYKRELEKRNPEQLAKKKETQKKWVAEHREQLLEYYKQYNAKRRKK